MSKYSTRNHVRQAIKMAIRNQERVSSELDGILQEYTQSYYITQDNSQWVSQEALDQRNETSKANTQYLTACIEYSLLLRDMLVKMGQQL